MFNISNPFESKKQENIEDVKTKYLELRKIFFKKKQEFSDVVDKGIGMPLEMNGDKDFLEIVNAIVPLQEKLEKAGINLEALDTEIKYSDNVIMGKKLEKLK